MIKFRLLSGFVGVILTLLTCSVFAQETGGAEPTAAVVPTEAPTPSVTPSVQPLPALSGQYVLDPKHTSVVFRISHLGFSYFTGRFDKAEGTLDYVADAPDQSKLEVTVYPNSIDTNVPELDEDLRGGNWFDTVHYPLATFHSTAIQPLDGKTVRVTGTLTLRGIARTIVMDVTLVGQGKNPVTGDYDMGFSGSVVLRRGEYGIANLEPMIGDDVTVQIDTEFSLKPEP